MKESTLCIITIWAMYATFVARVINYCDWNLPTFVVILIIVAGLLALYASKLIAK